MAVQGTTATRKSRRTQWLALVASLVLLVLVIRHFSRSAVLVRTATVERQDLVSSLSTNGNVEPQQDFEAHSPIAGTVKAVYVHEGEKVPAGKPLLALDDSSARVQVAAAQAALSTAQAQMDAIQQGGTQDEQLQLAAEIAKARAIRDQSATALAALAKLEQMGASSPSEVAAAKGHLAIAQSTLQNLEKRKTQRYAAVDRERAAADLANAQAAYSAALDTLHQENIRAPFAGTVYSVPVRPSEYVQAGDTLLKLANLAHIQVRAYFDEPEIGRLAVGLPATVVWDARPGMVWHGHIVRTPSTIITYGTRHVGEAILDIDNADDGLLPNTNVTLTVTLLRKENVLTVPREALHPDGNMDYVYQVVDGQLHKTPIKIGTSNMTMVEVISGLNEHATVALSTINETALRDGMTVQSVP